MTASPPFPDAARSAPARTLAITPDGVSVRGDCDYAAAHELAVTLRWFERRGRPFVVDLSEVVFADSSGLEPIAESVRRCRRAGRVQPRIVAPSPAVLRVLDPLRVRVDPFDLRAWDATAPAVPARTRSTVTTLITTTAYDRRSASIRVCGVLDADAALVLCALLTGHDHRGRRQLNVDVAQVSEVRPVAMDQVARVASELRAQVRVAAFSPTVRMTMMYDSC